MNKNYLPLIVGVLNIVLVSNVSLAQERVSTASYKYLQGHCSVSIKPDYVVIYGGVSARHEDLETALGVLEKRLKTIKVSVKKEKAKLIIKERIRFVDSKRYRSKRYNTTTIGQRLSFTIIQRLEIRLRLDSNIDGFLIELVGKGMNQLGKHYKQYAGRRRQVVTFYKINDFEKKLNTLKQQCTKTALISWCKRQGNLAEEKKCLQQMDQGLPRNRVTAFTVNAGPFLSARGASKTTYLRYPWTSIQLDKIELISDIALPLHGKINIKIF